MDAASARLAARLRAEETVMAMMSEDDLDRGDVCTSLASLPSVYSHVHTLTCLCGSGGGPHRSATCAGGFGSGLDGIALFGCVPPPLSRSLTLWKQRDKVKSVSVGIIACLNIGTEPPDATSSMALYSPSSAAAYRARSEAWLDPTSISPATAALNAIGEALHMAYIKLSPKAKFKLALDPTHEDVKRVCASLRKSAKEERVLMHYNGHGVPKPTSNCEVWVFNANFSQYIPLALADLIAWTGAPAMYVMDCSYAGALMPAFTGAVTGMPRGPSASDLTTAAGVRRTSGSAPSAAAAAAMHAAMAAGETPARTKDIIVLLACGAGEVLPTHPALPADVFTSCLTTPLKMALKCFVLRRTDVLPPMFHDYIFYVPGRLTDRRSPLGELNWILTSITDTIAWHMLPRPLFLRLFRQDVLCASLFRNYLLADRIMRQYGCVPQTYPALPPTHEHPLWHTWDAAVEGLLAQLPALLGYSAFDVQRLARLDLEPDVAHLGPEWGELLPAPQPPAPESSAASAATATAGTATVTSTGTATARAPSTTAAPARVSLTGSGAAAAGSGAQPRGSTRRSSSSNRRESMSAGNIPAAVAANLVPFTSLDFDTGSMDPMRMPLPPSVNATGEQRVRILRRRLAGLMPSTSVGPAPTFTPLGTSAYQHSVFFDEQLSAFEVWLREAAYLPLRRGAHLSSAIIEFVQASTTGSFTVGSAARLTSASTTMLRSGARSVMVPLTLQASAAVTSAAPPAPVSARIPGSAGAIARRTSRLSMNTPVAPPPIVVPLPPSQASADFSGTMGSTGSSTLVPVLRIQSPLQLPIILQVLLSQSQRLRALQLLARFVDLGHEAVNLTLMVGIHPYVSKLLSNPPPELAPTLVFVWAKILAQDRESGAVLVSSGTNHTFFIDYIERMASEHRARRKHASAPRRVAEGGDTSADAARGWRRKASPLARLLGVNGRRVRRSGATEGNASAQSDTERDGGAASVAGTTLPQSARASTGDDEASILQSDQTVMALFVLCRLMEDNAVGRRALSSPRLLTLLRQLLCDDERAWVQEWAAVTLAMLLVSNDDAKLVMSMQRCAAAAAASAGGLKQETSTSSRSNGSTTARSSLFAAPTAAAAATRVSAATPPQTSVTATINNATASTTTTASPGSFGFVGMATRQRGGSDDGLHLRLPPAAASTPQAPALDDVLRTLTDPNPVIRCAAAWVAGSVFREEADVVCSVPGAAAPSDTSSTPASASNNSAFTNAGASSSLVAGGSVVADFDLARHASEHLATRARLAPGSSASAAINTAPEDVFARHLTCTDASMLARDDMGVASTHGYLRAAWGIAYACYHAHGRLPFVWPSAQEVKDRANAQAVLARRRRVLLHILASRMQRTLLPANSSLTGPINDPVSGASPERRAGDSSGSASIASAAMTPPDAALFASADLHAAGYNNGSAALPIVGGRLTRAGGSTLAMPTSPGLSSATHGTGFAAGMASSVHAPMMVAPVMAGSFQMVNGSLPAGAVLPVVIPIQTATGIVQTTMSVPTSMLTPRAALPASFQAAADAAALEAPAMTEAPPADFLAEALAAAAAASKVSTVQMAGKGNSMASLHSVSSGAMFTSASTTGMSVILGSGMGDRNVSHESVGSMGTGAAGNGTPQARAGGRRAHTAGSDSYSAFAQLSPGRGHDNSSKGSLLSGADGVGTRKASVEPLPQDAGVPHSSSTPLLSENARASMQSLDAVALAAKQALSAARLAARQRIHALNAAFPDLANACGRNLREACFAACLPPFFVDGSVAMRVEALLAVARFAANRTHEAALCVAAAVTVMDFLTGGSCLVTALGEDTRGGGAVATASDAAGGAPMDATRPASSRLPPASAAGGAQSRAAGPTTRADRLRFGLMARLGHTLGFSSGAATPPAPAAPPRPAKPTMAEESPTPPSSRRDASMLGLPLELLPVHALAGALHFMSSVHRMRMMREDVGSGPAPRSSPSRSTSISSTSAGQESSASSSPPPLRVDEDAAVAWLLRDRSGRTDAVLTSTVRELGARGMLYAHIWIALVAATCDASDPVSIVASNIVRRIFYRVVGFAGLELAGKLPRAAVPRPAGSDSDARSPTWVPPPPTVVQRQRSESSADAATLELWERFPLPSHRDLALRSTVYERTAAYMYHPVFASSTSTMGADPMSATALARVTRHRLLQSALSEAVTLGAAAYDDLTVQFLIESSAALWTTMQQYGGSSLRAILAANLQLARQAWQMLAAQHLALTAVATPSAALVAQDSFAQIAEAYQQHASPEATGSPVPAGKSAASVGGSPPLGAPAPGPLPHGLFYVATTSPMIVGTAAPGSDAFSRALSRHNTGSALRYPATSGHVDTPGVELASFHHTGLPPSAYAGSAVTSSAPTSMLLAAGIPARVAAPMISMSPALAAAAPASMTSGLLPLPVLKGDVSPAMLPPMEALPPPRSRNSSAPAPTASSSPPLSASSASRSVVRRGSARPTPTSTPILMGANGPHRASRVPSEYDGAEGHDARVSAALLRNDASLLASSMGTPAPTDDASASGARSRSDVSASTAVAAVTGLVTDAPSRTPSMVSTGSSSSTPATSTSGAAAVSSAADTPALERLPSTSTVTGATGLSPILEGATAQAMSRHMSEANAASTRTTSVTESGHQDQASTSAAALLASQAAMFNAAGITLPPPIGEEDLDAQLRSAASVTPRLPPVMLARTQAITVRMARSAARKLVQKALIDTGARATTGLLFHPWADFIVCADESDTLSAWNFQDGSGLARFSNCTGGSGTTQGLWVPAWTSLLRSRVTSTPTITAMGATPVAGLDMAPIALPHSHASLARNAQGSMRSISSASRVGPPPELGMDGSSSTRSVSSTPAPPIAHRGRARVTAMTWINEHDTCHLLTCADDGVVRIWDGSTLASNLAAARTRMRPSSEPAGTPAAGSARAHRDTRSMSMSTSVSAVAAAAAAADAAAPSHFFNSPPLIASFSALPELHSAAFASSTGVGIGGASAGVEDASEQWAGMSCQWLPSRAHLAVGGGRCPYIRLWDVQRQQCIASHEFNTGARHPDGSSAHPGHVTTMSSAWPGTHIIMVGTSRGAIQVLDTRMGSGTRRDAGAVVLTLHEHKKWVVNVAQARSGAAYALISGSVAGDVRFWDLRRTASVHALVAYSKGQMTSLALHDFAPLMATGSKRQQVNVFTNSGDAMAELRYHDGFAGQRFGPVSSVAFHTHRLYLGVGALDNIVGVYSGIPSRSDMGFMGI